MAQHDDGRGGGTEEELPDGVIPLRPGTSPAEERAGCGVRGCLTGVSILFAVLLILLLVGLAVRVWYVPVVPPRF